nr:MAG TPA: hypothetical protein [Caudoviricetes sp.]
MQYTALKVRAWTRSIIAYEQRFDPHLAAHGLRPHGVLPPWRDYNLHGAGWQVIHNFGLHNFYTYRSRRCEVGAGARVIPQDHVGVKGQFGKNTISTYLALEDHVCVLVLNNTPLYRYEVVIEHMLTNYTRVR